MRMMKFQVPVDDETRKLIHEVIIGEIKNISRAEITAEFNKQVEHRISTMSRGSIDQMIETAFRSIFKSQWDLQGKAVRDAMKSTMIELMGPAINTAIEQTLQNTNKFLEAVRPAIAAEVRNFVNQSLPSALKAELARIIRL